MDSKERKRADGLLQEQLYEAALAAASDGSGHNADAFVMAIARIRDRPGLGLRTLIAMIAGIMVGSIMVGSSLWITAADLDECQADRASLIESAGP